VSILSRLLIAAVAVFGISSVATAKSITISGLQGQWRVYKSELANPDGVQAYSGDQLRAIVGNRLVISGDSVRWVISHGQTALREHTSFTEACVHPVVGDMGDEHFDIRCNGDDVFVPGLTMLRNGDLVVFWWDGLTLYLRKQK
jgi:hypothetical protein